LAKELGFGENVKLTSRTAVVLALGYLLESVPAHAARSLSFAQITGTPFPSQLVAAPKGNLLAWVANVRGARNVWVYDPGAAAAKARQLTAYSGDDGNEITSLTWNGDGRSLFYTRGGAGGGHLPYNPLSLPEGARSGEIWTVATAGGPPRKVAAGTDPAPSPRGDLLVFLRGWQPFVVPTDGTTEPTQLFQDAGSVAGIEWSPDGVRFAFVSSRDGHDLIGIYDLTGKSVTWLCPGIDADSEPTWSPDSTRIAFLRTAHEPSSWTVARPAGYPWEIWLASAVDGRGQRLFAARPGRGSHFQGLSNARHSLFWTADDRIIFPWEVTGWQRLYSVSLRAGDAPVLLTPGEGEVFAAVQSTDRKRLIYSSNLDDLDRRHIWEISSEKPRQLTHGGAVEEDPAVTTAGDLFALAADARIPLHPVRIESTGMHAILEDVRSSGFPAAELVEPQLVTFISPDGLTLHGQLFTPRNPEASHPAVLFFHGGPTRQVFAAWDPIETHAHLYAINQYLANHGYVVLSVAYRGGLGYGLDFREPKNLGVEGSSEVNDIVGAARFLLARGDVDPKRIGVWGGSYGGLMTALALSFTPEYFAAGVDVAGVSDWSRMPGTSGESPAALQLAYQASPLSRVDHWKAPVLLFHPDTDSLVPIQQSIVLASALRARGVEVDACIIPDETHFMLREHSWNTLAEITLRYFDEHLRSAATSAQRLPRASFEPPVGVLDGIEGP
jgi:dipeptidyl aminopeptidase/acylaminoacyl peptidase